MKNRPLWPLLPPVVVVGLMYLLVAVIHRMENTGHSSVAVCKIKQWTGWYCPGCGGTRCAEEITLGNWLTAMAYNPLLMTGFILFMAASFHLIIRITVMGKQAPKLPNISGPWIWLCIAGTALFTILRNIPSYPFTLLAP